jgi:hypothetical protein
MTKSWPLTPSRDCFPIQYVKWLHDGAHYVPHQRYNIRLSVFSIYTLSNLDNLDKVLLKQIQTYQMHFHNDLDSLKNLLFDENQPQ